MRDGLHYGAPVGTRWKRAIKDVVERADYVEAGARRIAAALLAELKSDLRPTFVPALIAEMADEAGRLFKTEGLASDRRPPRGLRNDLNDAEQAVAAAARRRVQMCSDAVQVVQSALADVMNERLENNHRLIVTHVLVSAPADVDTFRQRWSAAEEVVDTGTLALSVVDNSDRDIVRAREPALDLDANLLGRK